MAATSTEVCVLIPAFQAAQTIQPLLEQTQQYADRILVVDDGSSDDTARLAETAGAKVLRHSVNRGKGAALKTGIAYFQEHPCEFLVTMDADGQHAPAAIPRFLRAYERTHIPVLLGNRMADRGQMPWLRRRTNQLMSWLISRATGQYIPDSQCGYRLFHRSSLLYLCSESAGFAAESEFLLHLADRGIRIGSVRVPTIYDRKQRSCIRPIRDTFQFFRMLRRFYRYRRRRNNGALDYPEG